MVSNKAKKRLTYFTMGAYFFMEGVEYAVILPSVWLYLHERFGSQEYFLGLTLSAFCLSGLFAGPLLGRWADKSRQVRLILCITAFFEMAGSFMYFVGFSAWFLVGSRFVAGIGIGGEAVILAEISRFTTEEERTGVISILIATRQSGLLLGPGFNFFLSQLDFFLGPFHVDKFTSPGLLMAIIWVVMEIFLIFLFSEPEKLFNKMHVMEHVETTYGVINSSDEEQYDPLPSNASHITYDDVYPELTETAPSGNGAAISRPKGMVNSSWGNISGSVGNSSAMNVSIGSVGSIESSTSVGNPNHFIESAEIMMQTDSTSSNERTKLLKRQLSKKKKKDKSSFERSTSESCNGKADVHDSIPEENFWKFCYDEYVREEIIVLLGLQFITIFVQVALETMVTPLTDKFLHWDEFDNSLLYCGAGIEIILMFLVTRKLSQRVEDRWLLLIGGCVLTASNAWLLYFIPSCTVDTPIRTMAGFLVGVVFDMIALPFLMVCGVSLYSKLTRKETQGLSQGLRRSVSGLGTLLAPLWASSTINMPYVLMGVIFAILLISQTMMFLSFSRLKVPQHNTQASTSLNRKHSDERQPLLGDIS